jgi:hypothetical protein
MGTPITGPFTFRTRQFYNANGTNTAKDSTLTFADLDETLLSLSASAASGSSLGIYDSAFPNGTEVPYAVGGIPAETDVATLNGKTFSQMFDELLFPTINPTDNPGSLVSTTSRIYEEIGDVINVIVTSTFTQGTWTVVGQSNRNYYGAATLFFFSSSTDTEFSNSNPYTFSDYVVTSGLNNFPTAVSHSIGDQPVNSKGANYLSPISAGKLIDNTVSFTGIYPWFYGSSSAATLSVATIVTAIEDIYALNPTNAVRNIELSNGTITASYPEPTNYWLWFAIPATNSKNKWYQNDLNNGDIGGNTNTFGSPTTTQINTYDNAVSYKIYITNFKTNFAAGANAGTVQFRNS